MQLPSYIPATESLLIMMHCCPQLLTYAVEVVELLPHMPIFNNLEYLVLEEWSVNLNGVALLKILQKSPRLKRMVFSEVTSPALHCLLSCMCSILFF